MNCNKTEEKLIGYLLNTLSLDEGKQVEIHLASCQHCQRRLEELTKARGLLKEWKAVNPPPDLTQKVLDNVVAQKLIEERISPELHLKDIQMKKVFEWLRKRVKSEQIRIYKILTDFLGKEKGEEVFEYYLEKELREQMSIPPEDIHAISKSLGLNVEVARLEEGIIREIIYNCPYLTMAKELDVKIDPCEVICGKIAKLREKFQPLKIALIKKMPNREGECIFLLTPLTTPSS